MNVLVAGATGAIGRPLISALVSARHNVFGMTSSKPGLQTLKEDGAEVLLASALDAQAVDAAIKRARPEVVIDELTSLPKHYTPDEMRAVAERDRKLRLEGGQNVLNAARAAGARKYIIQSAGFYYAPGPGLRTKQIRLHATRGPRLSQRWTYTQLENRTLGAQGLEGVALRYGFF
jgi:nucleoside-diphosphate-sugar epimerase